MIIKEKDREMFLRTMKDMGQTPEVQAAVELSAIAVYDYAFFKSMETHEGLEKALALHKDAWMRYAPEHIMEAKDLLGIDTIKNMHDTGRVIRYSFEVRGCIFNIVEDTPDKFVGEVTRSILCEYCIESLGEKRGGPYLRSLAAIEKSLVSGFISEAGLSESVEVEIDKNMCLGDDRTRIILRRKI